MVVAEMLKHIGFTERWLRRAKAECAEGALVRGVLTLSLAEAEIRRARELGASAVARGEAGRAARIPVPQTARIAVGVLSLLLVLAVAMIAVPQALPVAVVLRSGDTASHTPAISFDRPIGSILAMVQVPPEVSLAPESSAAAAPPAPRQAIRPRSAGPATAASAAPVRVSQVLHAGSVPAASVRPVAETPAPAFEPGTAEARDEAQPRPVSPAAETVATSPARPVVDGGQLIDLVLVAERTLRGARF